MACAGRFKLEPLNDMSRPPENASPNGQGAKFAFTIREAVLASGLSRSMLYIAIARGVLRARKCGSRTLILDSDLRRFLRSLPRVAKNDGSSDAPPPPSDRGARKRGTAGLAA
jgi:hypothetical protein